MNTDQNRTLGGCTTLDEKLRLLATWRRTNEINIYQYRWFTNKWINRYKKEILSPTPVQHQDIELTRMNNELRQKIAFRVLFPTLYLDSPSKAKFTKCLETAYRHQENELLALALRCPHENLAEIAGEYVAAHRVKKLPIGASHSLWRTVWNDEYVPMDAIRIMMPPTEAEETSVLKNCFGKVFLSELYPLVKVHKEREVFRRDTALSYEETALAEKRIRAFDKLLEKIEGVCQE